MTKASHTSGPWSTRPWIISPAFVEFEIIGPNGEEIGFANLSDGADGPTTYPVEANARLMAAAPDLLAIAKRWAAIDGGSWDVARHEREKAQLESDTLAAIALATGEPS